MTKLYPRGGTRSRRLFALAAILPLLAGCSAPTPRLEVSLESARQAVAAVRPGADLSEARVETWTAAQDLEALSRGEHGAISLLDVRRAWRAQSPILLELCVVLPATHAQVEKELISVASGNVFGISFPSQKLILVKAEAARSLEALAHELGHLASARMGYGGRRELLSLRGADKDSAELTPSWIDLDALVAYCATGEGEAQVTAQAAIAFRTGGAAGLDRYWEEPVKVDLDSTAPTIVGPAASRLPDSSGEEAPSGVKRRIPGDLVQTLHYLLYQGSVASVKIHHHSGEPLEGTLQRLWSNRSFVTRELLWPGGPPDGSRMAALARRRGAALEEAGVAGATRLGALLLRELLVRMAHIENPRALKLAAGLEDDLALRTSGGGILWITRWREEAFAEDFANLYRELLARNGRKGRLDREGRTLTAIIGDLPAPDRILEMFRD